MINNWSILYALNQIIVAFSTQHILLSDVFSIYNLYETLVKFQKH